MAANLVTNVVLNKNIWEFRTGNAKQCVSFNIGTEDSDRFFQNVTVFTGAIINHTQNIIKYVSTRVGSTDSVVLFDVDKDLLDRAIVIPNKINQPTKWKFTTEFIFSQIELNPKDTIMFVLVAKNSTRFGLIAKYANRTAQNSADSVLCVSGPFRQAKRESEIWVISSLVIVILTVIYLLALHISVRRSKDDYASLLDKLIEQQKKS